MPILFAIVGLFLQNCIFSIHSSMLLQLHKKAVSLLVKISLKTGKSEQIIGLPNDIYSNNFNGDIQLAKFSFLLFLDDAPYTLFK